jgi:hypothetical protein
MASVAAGLARHLGLPFLCTWRGRLQSRSALGLLLFCSARSLDRCRCLLVPQGVGALAPTCIFRLGWAAAPEDSADFFECDPSTHLRIASIVARSWLRMWPRELTAARLLHRRKLHQLHPCPIRIIQIQLPLSISPNLRLLFRSQHNASLLQLFFRG